MTKDNSRLIQAIKQRVEELTEKVEELENKRGEAIFISSRAGSTSDLDYRSIYKTRKTADHAIVGSEYMIIGNAIANDINFTLPPITIDNDGEVHLIHAENIITYDVTVTPSGADTISKNANYIFSGESTIMFIADFENNNWITK